MVHSVIMGDILISKKTKNKTKLNVSAPIIEIKVGK